MEFTVQVEHVCSEGSGEATDQSDALNENFCSARHNLMTAIILCDFVRAAPIKQQERAAMLCTSSKSLSVWKAARCTSIKVLVPWYKNAKLLSCADFLQGHPFAAGVIAI